MTDDNFKYYLLTIVLAPCVFYVPKFFELYAEETRVGVDIDVNCHSILHPPKVNMTAMKGWSNNSVIVLSLENFNVCHFSELFGVVPEDFMRKYLGEPPNPTEQQREDPFLKECQAANFTGLPHQDWKLNVTQVLQHFSIIEVFSYM